MLGFVIGGVSEGIQNIFRGLQEILMALEDEALREVNVRDMVTCGTLTLAFRGLFRRLPRFCFLHSAEIQFDNTLALRQYILLLFHVEFFNLL